MSIFFYQLNIQITKFDTNNTVTTGIPTEDHETVTTGIPTEDHEIWKNIEFKKDTAHSVFHPLYITMLESEEEFFSYMDELNKITEKYSTQEINTTTEFIFAPYKLGWLILYVKSMRDDEHKKFIIDKLQEYAKIDYNSVDYYAMHFEMRDLIFPLNNTYIERLNTVTNELKAIREEAIVLLEHTDKMQGLARLDDINKQIRSISMDILFINPYQERKYKQYGVCKVEIEFRVQSVAYNIFFKDWNTLIFENDTDRKEFKLNGSMIDEIIYANEHHEDAIITMDDVIDILCPYFLDENEELSLSTFFNISVLDITFLNVQ